GDGLAWIRRRRRSRADTSPEPRLGARARSAHDRRGGGGDGGVGLMRRSDTVLEIEGLAFAYPDGHQALFGVDLVIRRGERVALLGPNGAGKTTLVLHCNGVLTAGAGRVRVGGLPITKPYLPEIRRQVGIVFQDPDDQLF